MEGKGMQRAIAAVALVALVGGAVAWQTMKPKPFEFTLLFKEGGGIARGHKVLLVDVPIGEVAAVELTPENQVKVRVRLNEGDQARIKEGATGYVNQTSLVSVSSEKVVELYNASDENPPLASGAELKGMNGLMELKGWQAARGMENMTGRAKAKVAEYYDRAMAQAREAYESMRKSSEGEKVDPETQGFLDDLKKALDQRMENIEKELPDLEKRYREAYEKLKTRGSGEWAEQVKKAWEAFRKSLEDGGK